MSCAAVVVTWIVSQVVQPFWARVFGGRMWVLGTDGREAAAPAVRLALRASAVALPRVVHLLLCPAVELRASSLNLLEDRGAG